jgi:hypothetical protein
MNEDLISKAHLMYIVTERGAGYLRGEELQSVDQKEADPAKHAAICVKRAAEQKVAVPPPAEKNTIRPGAGGLLKRTSPAGKVALAAYFQRDAWMTSAVLRRRSGVEGQTFNNALTALTLGKGVGVYKYAYLDVKPSPNDGRSKLYKWSGKYDYPFEKFFETDTDMLPDAASGKIKVEDKSTPWIAPVGLNRGLIKDVQKITLPEDHNEAEGESVGKEVEQEQSELSKIDEEIRVLLVKKLSIDQEINVLVQRAATLSKVK